jgi:hypothetical protein
VASKQTQTAGRSNKVNSSLGEKFSKEIRILKKKLEMIKQIITGESFNNRLDQEERISEIEEKIENVLHSDSNAQAWP